MSDHPYQRLSDVVDDALFPEVDLALRAGRHIDAAEHDQYAFLSDAAPLLEPFYRRFGAELVRVADGYFYLLPSGDRLPRRALTVAEMLVGQALALLYLNPMIVVEGGLVERAQLIETLASLVGEERLLVALNPRRRGRKDERVAQDGVRKEIDRAVRALASLGFLDLVEEGRYRLRAPVLRFADVVRGLDDAEAALRNMIARGEALADARDDEEDEP